LLISEIFGDRTKSKLYFTSTGEQLWSRFAGRMDS
jgi:hypothetical protein